MPIHKVQKRNGAVVDFDPQRIADAIFAAAKSVGGDDYQQAEDLSKKVLHSQ